MKRPVVRRGRMSVIDGGGRRKARERWLKSFRESGHPMITAKLQLPSLRDSHQRRLLPRTLRILEKTLFPIPFARSAATLRNLLAPCPAQGIGMTSP